MGFGQAVDSCFTQAFNWRGRASRSEYWWFILFALLCYAVTVVVTIQLEYPVVAFTWLVLVVPTIGAGVRRLHDTDRSGWWWLLAVLPFGAFVLLAFYCFRGDPGPNRYGMPPVAPPVL
jgi:uncharacterized membrane protein YhaH (DUF805 family)